MVQSKSDRERQKLITDKCQSLIEVLLKDEDNKYCVDCDAKGPRWASWNLGVFLCIRCAGIHRNLGVHISRVKSVNLDAWTPEHVAHVQRMGNSRARAIYEANLPDDFRRPQTDTALESFIRAKYEHKKYLAHNYVDPGPPEPAFNVDEEIKRIKEQKRSKLSGASNKPMLSVSSELSTPNPKPRPTLPRQQLHQPAQENVVTSSTNTKTAKTNSSALADLIDLDLGFGSPAPSTNINNISLKSSNDSAVTSSASSNLASLADLMNPSTTSNLFNQMTGPTSQATLLSSSSSSSSKAPIFSNITSSSASSTMMSPFASFGTTFPSTLTPTTTSLHPTPAAQATPETKTTELTSTPSKNVLDLLDL